MPIKYTKNFGIPPGRGAVGAARNATPVAGDRIWL